MSKPKLKFDNLKMENVENVYDEIIQEIKKETDKIISEGKKKARFLRRQMEEETEKEVKIILDKAKKVAELRRKKILSMNEIEIKRINLTKKNQIIEDVLQKALDKLKEFAETNPNYKNYLIKYCKQGIERVYSFKLSQIENQYDEITKFIYKMKISCIEIDKENIEIFLHVNERDKKFITEDVLKSLMETYKVKISLKFNNKIIGGVIISTSDESVLMNNTFQERLKINRFDIIQKIADIFW
ncbi:MAG: V-type ATP synthase subunit E [Candidatus Helarchaeota archaeon]